MLLQSGAKPETKNVGLLLLLRVQMHAVALTLRTQMMDHKINSALYVKVLKRTHEFPTER